MPFRSAQERHDEDTAVLRGPGNGLAEGEWIAYWRDLPHSVKGRMTSEATVSTMTPTGQLTARFDAGVAALARVRLGIVDWRLLDSHGAVVPWEPTRAAELVEGLPEDTFATLSGLIGAGEHPDLDAPANPDLPNSESAGND